MEMLVVCGLQRKKEGYAETMSDILGTSGGAILNL
eukprot:CAMPEP_0172882026 /NCGR_PEP_ID=MMETSP1075-20121228/119034_1 /TAXON_ID=2916 /ORGANISM="Ceratium fusus, Strain PA161109" /LENGTH=34 /DNA_ID= /DNA_START= /DNA_END= /DNA_ORIENTATION=